MYAVGIQYNRRGAVGARLAHNQKDGRSKLLDDKMLERAPPFIKIIIKILIIFCIKQDANTCPNCHPFLVLSPISGPCLDHRGSLLDAQGTRDGRRWKIMATGLDVRISQCHSTQYHSTRLQTRRQTRRQSFLSL